VSFTSFTSSRRSAWKSAGSVVNLRLPAASLDEYAETGCPREELECLTGCFDSKTNWNRRWPPLIRGPADQRLSTNMPYAIFRYPPEVEFDVRRQVSLLKTRLERTMARGSRSSASRIA